MTGVSLAQDAWVGRVLGVRIPEAGDPTAWRAAITRWRDANDAVNAQIEELRGAILDRLRSPDPNLTAYVGALRRIAETGLNAVTEDRRVKLMAAIMDLGDGAPDAMARSGARTLATIVSFQDFMVGSRKISACDGNPFGVPVAIRATLEPALKDMADTLSRAIGQG